MSDTPYTKGFFDRREDSLRSARVMVPLVLEYLTPKSVLDVGCGTGAFLSVFKEKGVTDIVGVDGPWVSKEQRLISPDVFLERDLKQPLSLKRKFDLVVSLEVGEHLPAEAAYTFIESLTRHGDVVLFSAAIPNQGGTHHVNEQWPAYWVALFKKHGYVAVDCLREKIWNSPEVSFWYSQNALFFVKKEVLGITPKLQQGYERRSGVVLPLVHPALLETKAVKAKRYDRFTSPIPFSVRRMVLKILRAAR